MSNIYDKNFDIWGANPGSSLMAIALCSSYATTVNNNAMEVGGKASGGLWFRLPLVALVLE